MESILNTEFTTTYNTAPFSKINQAHYKAAFEKAINKAQVEIDSITQNPAEPTLANTIEALAYSGMELDRISNIFFNLNSAETNDELQKIAQEVAPLLTAFSNDISLNEKLFERVKVIYDQKDTLDLNTEQLTLLVKNYKSFVRNGALLTQEQKQVLRTIDTQLALESLKFGENVLAETHNYQLHITNPDDLKGLPEGSIEQSLALAQSLDKPGWIFTLDYPSYIPFMTYADNRELRKQLAIAAGEKAFKDNAHNNQEIVLKIVNLRHQRARLLGYDSHADFVLEERMAQSPSKVNSFLEELLQKAKPAAIAEFEELKAFAYEIDQIKDFQKWDGAYYSEKLKQQRFNLDDEILKPYFQLENVLEGAFEVSKKLFGLNFQEVFDIDTYHKEVQTYLVTQNDGEFKAILYTDFFPRKGKRNGAWMTSFKSQYKKDNLNERPHISIVCNFTKPTATKPSLLTFNEVTTLFHEFGHALHGILADTQYPSLSGTNVYWDFVELPSQILENWCYQQEALELFARHYQTHEPIPMDLIEKIKQSASFQEGMATLRQLSFGILDMGWHSGDPSQIKSLKEFELGQFKSTQLYPDVAHNAMSPSFSHIFQGGYAAGYYSYKWAEVLDADAFDYFKQHGIFNKEIAQKFQDHILSQGGTDHPMTLYKKFRGHEPSPEALLKRAGLIK